MRILSRFSLAALLVSLIFSGCKKERNDDPPVITFNSPAENQAYTVLDTIAVSVSITDDEGLSQYSITLCNSALVPVQQGVSGTATGHAANVQFPYVIDNLQLTDGNYFLVASATDAAGNVERQYRTIAITSLPQVRRGFFLVSVPNAATVNVSKVDSAWNVSSFASYVSDYSASAFSPHWQQLYICGKQTGDLRAVNVPSASPAWSQSALPGPTDYFTSVSCVDDYLYVSYRADALKGFDHTGSLHYTATVSNGYYPIHSLWSNNRLYAEQKDPASSGEKLVVYNGGSGVGMQEVALPVTVKALFERDNNSLYVLGNTGGQGKLLIYDYTSNGTWEPIALPAGTVTGAAKVDANTLLIAMSDGTIYKFTYSPIGLLTFVGGVQAQQLRYDPLQNQVIAAEANTLKVYSYTSAALAQTVVNADSIADVHIWYNR